MTLKNLIAFVVFIGTLGSAIAFFDYIKRFISAVGEWLSKPMGSKRPPRSITFAITPDYSQCHWIEGGTGGVPHMLIICGLNVTNAGPANVGQIVDAYISKPHTRPRNYIDPNILYPRGFAKLTVFNFQITPPVVKSGECFVADVVLVDQFAGKHRAEKVSFAPSAGKVWGV